MCFKGKLCPFILTPGWKNAAGPDASSTDGTVQQNRSSTKSHQGGSASVLDVSGGSHTLVQCSPRAPVIIL